MRRLLTWLVALAILAGGVYLGSPYYTVYRLVQAARAGDAKTVSGFVDFPAVRSSLKPQLEGYLADEIGRENAKPHSIWDRLGLALAPYLVGTSVDMLVTPQNVAAMIRTGRPPHVSNPVGDQARAADDKGPGDSRALHLGYVGDDLDQFNAEVVSRSNSHSRVTLRLLRRGFFTWRVVGLDLPALHKTVSEAPAI